MMFSEHVMGMLTLELINEKCRLCTIARLKLRISLSFFSYSFFAALLLFLNIFISIASAKLGEKEMKECEKREREATQRSRK